MGKPRIIGVRFWSVASLFCIGCITIQQQQQLLLLQLQGTSNTLDCLHSTKSFKKIPTRILFAVVLQIHSIMALQDLVYTR